MRFVRIGVLQIPRYDYFVAALGTFLFAGFLLSPPVERAAAKLARYTLPCMAVLATLPILLRVLLLGGHPVPNPRVSDDFSYLLLGDTLAHFRLANPMHPMHRFFEGVFTLQEPSWSSTYPLGQGLVLAVGQVLFGNPWIGVLLSVGVMCALCYWMLRAWVAPEWALLGGLLAVLQFGPLSSWMNSYWGGAVSAIAGCLIFGALPRIHAKGRTRDAVILGAGLGLQMLTRPYEFVLIMIGVVLFFIPRRAWLIACIAMLPAAGLTLLQNKQVTGNWTTLPYVQSQYQYGIPSSFTWQPMPVPHQTLTLEQQMDYDAQAETHGRGSYAGRLIERVRFYRFFFLAPLYLALPFLLPALREGRFIRVLVVIAILCLGTTFYPYFYPHYIAVATCLFVLIAVKGLERMPADAARIVFLLCLAHFAFWYGVHLFGNTSLARYESGNVINEGDPQGRLAINKQLAEQSGQQLVFVRYWPQHGPYEWIHNAADIDGARVVWALDLGPEEDAKLRRYFPHRTAWLLEPDVKPPRLRLFTPE